MLSIVAILKVKRIKPGGMAFQAVETGCAKVLGPEKSLACLRNGGGRGGGCREGGVERG